MIAAALLAASLTRPARADELGGHDLPSAAAAPDAGLTADQRRATLEELWQRRILPPDQDGWSPADMVLLLKIRRNEDAAERLLRATFGGDRPWVSRPKDGAPPRLTKDGYEKYVFVLTQDAIDYFQSKGGEAKNIFRFVDWQGRAVFDTDGLITEDGARLYYAARAKLPAFWRGPDGRVYGTRRPPNLPAPAPVSAPSLAAPPSAPTKNP